ncbi:HdeD family acid-resistance protein [Cnuibacter sp. UC19_7]|uniref:HdeD family acid-resistance protein n=1 Tax=Cnuibacter sp. UC19_7 TaxID=3350166 RepID=UPI00366D614B
MSTPTQADYPGGFWLFAGDITETGRRWLKTGLWVRAVLSLLLGVVILVLAFNNPDAIAWTIALLFAIYFWVVGLIRVVQGIVNKDYSGGMRALNIILGVLLVIAGVIAIRNPVVSLLVLAFVVGFSWIFEGILAIMETAKDSSKWLGTLLGVLSLLAGIVVIFLPLESISVLILFAGVFLIVSAIMSAVTALMLGRGPKTVA